MNYLSPNLTNIFIRDCGVKGYEFYKDLIVKLFKKSKIESSYSIRAEVLRTFEYTRRPLYLKIEPLINSLERANKLNKVPLDVNDLKSLVNGFQNEVNLKLEVDNIEDTLLRLKVLYCSEYMLSKELSLKALFENSYLVLSNCGEEDKYARLTLRLPNTNALIEKKLQQIQFFFFYNFLEYGEQSTYSINQCEKVSSIKLKASFLYGEVEYWRNANIIERKESNPINNLNKMWNSFKEQMTNISESIELCKETGNRTEKQFHLLIPKEICLNKFPSIESLIERKQQVKRIIAQS